MYISESIEKRKEKITSIDHPVLLYTRAHIDNISKAAGIQDFILTETSAVDMPDDECRSHHAMSMKNYQWRSNG